MAINKTGLYSSLRNSCDELREGTDESQYNDYFPSFLFMKYSSNKGAGETSDQ